MALRPTTVRFAPDAYELVRTGAEAAGVSIAQFIREAAIMRAIVLLSDETAADGVRREMGRLSAHVRTTHLARNSGD